MMESKTGMGSRIGKRNRIRMAAVCLVVLLAGLWTVQPASAKWARWSTTAIGGGGVYLALKNNLLERLPDMFDTAGSGFVEGDDGKVESALKEMDDVPAHIVTDAFPVLGAVEAAGEKLKRMAESVKRKASRFVGRAREAAVDSRVALAGLGRKGGGLARRIFDAEPLSKPDVGVSSRALAGISSPWDAPGAASAKGAADSWAKNDPWAKSDPWAKRDPWARSGWDPEPAAQERAAPSSGFRERVEAEQRARPNCYGVVSDDSEDCKEGGGRDASQDEYNKALSRTLGEDVGTGGDYMVALSNLERKEAERKAREAAERRRLEEERRARELAERQRIEAEKERKRARLAAKKARRRARLAREAEEQREFERMVEMEAREQGENLIDIFAGMAQGMTEYYTSKHQQELEHKQRVAEQRRRQAEIAWQRQQEREREQEQAWRRQQQRRQEEQRRQARLRQEEEERRKRQEAERQRREAERERREAERLAKAARRDACRRQISGARNGCVQVVKWHGVGAFAGTYTLRNNCSYSINVWHGKSRELGSLMTIRAGGTRDTAPTFHGACNNASMSCERVRIRYLACYDAPGVSGSGGSCKLTYGACAGVE